MEVYGKSFCFTGQLVRYSRRDVNALVRRLGGTVSNHVCASTDYLVSSVKTGRKMVDANRMGVKVITEEEFMEMVA